MESRRNDVYVTKQISIQHLVAIIHDDAPNELNSLASIYLKHPWIRHQLDMIPCYLYTRRGKLTEIWNE
jgi:hypothetical protein